MSNRAEKDREAFQRFTELLASLEDCQLPRRDIREWFVAAGHAWALSTDGRHLEQHLGLTRRVRSDYLRARQRRYLDDALETFVAGRSGSEWRLAGEFVDQLKAFERRRDKRPPPDSSRLERALFLAFQRGLPVPTSQRHWYDELQLKTIGLCRSVETSEASPLQPGDETMVMAKKGPVIVSNAHDVRIARLSGYKDDELQFVGDARGAAQSPDDAHLPLEDRCKAQWQLDPEIRADFGCFEEYFAYERAVAAGQVKVYKKPV